MSLSLSLSLSLSVCVCLFACLSLCLCVSLLLSLSLSLSVVWERGSAVGVGKAREWESRTWASEEASTAGTGGPGAGHCPQQGWDVQCVTRNTHHTHNCTHSRTHTNTADWQVNMQADMRDIYIYRHKAHHWTNSVHTNSDPHTHAQDLYLSSLHSPHSSTQSGMRNKTTTLRVDSSLLQNRLTDRWRRRAGGGQRETNGSLCLCAIVAGH